MKRKEFPAGTYAKKVVMLEAEPKPLEIDLQRTALIIVDMQNSFVKKGGLLDLAGQLNVEMAQNIIEPIQKIRGAARARECKVIYTASMHSADLREWGGPDSPYRYARVATLYREHPEWRDQLLFRGTWGANLIEELKPKEGDIIVEKTRYSAFFQTNLDAILKAFSIKYLVFVGTATNVCVEATVRDAFNFDYWSILISDAVASGSPKFVQDATFFNVKYVYGHVTSTENILKAMT